MRPIFLIGLLLLIAGCSDNEDYSCTASPPKTTTQVPEGCHATSLP